MHSARSEEKQAGPDQGQLADHVWHSLCNFRGEQLLLLAINRVYLHREIVRIAESVHHDPEREPTEAKPAYNESTCHSNPALEVAPARLQSRRIHEGLPDPKREPIAVNEGERVLDLRASEHHSKREYTTQDQNPAHTQHRKFNWEGWMRCERERDLLF